MWVRAQGYAPLTAPLEGFPPDAGNVVFASGELAGSSNGLLQEKDGSWSRTLSGAPVLAVGLWSGGWWAAGAGFLALPSGARYEADDRFVGGCSRNDEIFLTGGRGIWRYSAGKIALVREITQADRIRLFNLRGTIYALFGGDIYEWKENAFVRSEQWRDFHSRDLVSVQQVGSASYFVCADGIYRQTAAGMDRVFEEIFKRSLREGIVGFHIGADANVVVATYNGGVTAYNADQQSIWHLTADDLGGNPYSLVQIGDGYYVGTSGGAVAILGGAVYRAKLKGSDVLSVTDERIHFATEAFELRTAQFTPAPGYVEKDGASGGWDSIVLPGGKRVHLGGRDVRYVGRYRNGWVAVQENVMSIVTPDGQVASTVPVIGAGTVQVDHDRIWIGSSIGLFSWDGNRLAQEIKGESVRVANGEAGPVFLLHSSMRLPNGTDYPLPGEILAASGRYAALATNTGTFVGTYARGQWAPLDIPGIGTGILAMVVQGEYLYLISSHEVLRVYLPAIHRLKLEERPPANVSLSTDDFAGTVPAARPLPWPSAKYDVIMAGQRIPVTGQTYSVPRVPYGETTVEVIESIGGLKATQVFHLIRSRPWWLGWPGAVVAGTLLYGGIWLIIRIRTRRLSRHAAELRHKVDEQTKALKEALRAREFFFSSVSHEIRNPLNGVVGLCDMLSESNVGSREKLLIRTLVGCSDQLRRILDDVLDFSRIDRGEIEFFPEPFELAAAVEGASRAVDPRLERVQLSMPENVWMEGDVGKLRQIITNLVSNALKYGQPPLARVEAKCALQEDGRVAVDIHVSNSGPDLAADERERIFEGFQRGTAAKNQRVPGSGLGLALSRRFARGMGGDLTVTSAGSLTVFTLHLSLKPASAPNEALSPIPSTPSRALAIEDEQYNRLVLGHILANMGYSVDWAVDGASALESARSGGYDLILTDYMLPDMDGVELAQELLKQLPDPRPPIVMVTAYSTAEKQEAAYAAGVSGFVTKPVSQKKLQAALLGLGYSQRARRSLDVFRPAGRFDFSVFKRMPDGRIALGRFADDFSSHYQELVGLVGNGEALRKAAHALRSAALVIHASSLAEQLDVLEGVAVDADPERIARVLAVIEPMIQDLVDTCRNEVLSNPDFTEALRGGVPH